MITIPNKMLEEFVGRFNTHKANIAACNIFYHTMIMLNHKKSDIITREMFDQEFRNALSDIELVTSPTDAFVPNDSNEMKETKELFVINQLAAEYIEITKRMPLSLIEETYGPANALVILLKQDPKNVEKFHDDLFLYFMLFKYLDQIDIIRLNIFSNYTPIIEYIVENITLKDWKDYIKTNKTNPEKYASKCEDVLFNPDISAVYKYYNTSEDAPKLDVVNLMMRLVNNMVLKNDIILILGVYLIISFAMSDFNNKKAEDSPCAKYVRDVLSKI
jgi:hypothetical protein